MVQLDGPSDDGLLAPEPVRPDEDELLEQRRAEIQAAADQASIDPPALTSEEEAEVVDLLSAGRKERWPIVFGRRIHLRTLTMGEELKLAEITKPYIGTDAYARAYRAAVVAAAIRTIDGELLFNPISSSDFDNLIFKKFEKMMDWYPLAVDQIFRVYREMELELLALVEKLGKSLG